ncbi:hypothetical protein N0V87_006022 [Didymella glomerata]|uniref:Uncharacterized protein n=1 Tax=Didymella glomerata TaxID=749621 RepID=A0A9W8WXG8_9PLEO|nr:hypothetical protein N0V87_006022 [Didymella glomerata]
MPPHDLSRIIARSLTNETTTGLVTPLIVVPIVVVTVTVLIIAAVLVSKGCFSNVAGKVDFCRSNDAEMLRIWPGQKTYTVESSATKKPERTIVQRHLEMLRAWQKPTIQAQPPLPLYLGRPETTRHPCRPTGMTFDEWDKGYRNLRPRGPAYWKKYGEEMEARKPWWQKTQDKLRKCLLNSW